MDCPGRDSAKGKFVEPNCSGKGESRDESGAEMDGKRLKNMA